MMIIELNAGKCRYFALGGCYIAFLLCLRPQPAAAAAVEHGLISFPKKNVELTLITEPIVAVRHFMAVKMGTRRRLHIGGIKVPEGSQLPFGKYTPL
jgi:hypothetical protein